MAGSIRRRATSTGDARWQARFRSATGERVKTFPRKADAQRWLTEQQAAADRGQWVDPRMGRRTLAAYADDWLRGLRRSPGTIDNTRRRLRLHVLPHLGDVPMSALRPADMRAWVAELEDKGLSAGEVKAIYFLAAKLLRLAATDGIIARSPCVEVELPKAGEGEEQRFLGAEAVERLADAIDPRYRAYVYTAAYAGPRPGELFALTVGRVDLLGGRLDIREALTEISGRVYRRATKTDESRKVPIPPFLVAELERHVAEHARPPILFPAPGGGEIRRRNFHRRIFKPAVVRADLDPRLRLYDLRHTYAALCIEQGVHVRELQERMGHSSSRVTLDTYGHLLPSLDARLTERLEAVREAAKASAGNVVSLGE